MTGTRVYGASDDLIEFGGEFTGEACGLGAEDKDPALVVTSDGTVLTVWYGDRGIWYVRLLHRGGLFDRIDQCDDVEADPHSDVAHFAPGIRWAYVAKAWESVR